MEGIGAQGGATPIEDWSDSLDLQRLQASYGTPLYVFNRERLRQNFSRFADLARGPTMVLYPVKANPSIPILREIARLGGGADCASEHEVQLARTCGIETSGITYNTPAPSYELAQKLLCEGATVVVDSTEMLSELPGQIDREQVRGRILIRVSPEVDIEYLGSPHGQELLAHGSSSNKFGIPSESIVEQLKSFPLPVSGLHFHVGTQMDNVDTFVKAAGLLHHLTDEINAETAHELNVINLGGGLGIPFTDGESFPSIPEYADTLGKVLRSQMHYMFEPGHALIGDAIGLLIGINIIKEMRGRRWAIVDAGTDQLAKITLSGWRHQIVDRDHRPLKNEGPDALGGPLCFAGDTLLQSTVLDGMNRGDPLFVKHCGAYCFALSSHFNGLHSPPLLTIDGNGDEFLTNSAEEEWYDQTYLSYNWHMDGAPWPETEPIDIERAMALSSDYLQVASAGDSYRITSAERTGERSFKFKMFVGSSVDFVSMPYALRTSGDALIIATMMLLGKESKDVNVWGTRLAMWAGDIIKPNREIECLVSLSPIVEREPGSSSTLLAQFDLDGGKFSGLVRVVV